MAPLAKRELTRTHTRTESHSNSGSKVKASRGWVPVVDGADSGRVCRVGTHSADWLRSSRQKKRPFVNSDRHWCVLQSDTCHDDKQAASDERRSRHVHSRHPHRSSRMPGCRKGRPSPSGRTFQQDFHGKTFSSPPLSHLLLSGARMRLDFPME